MNRFTRLLKPNNPHLAGAQFDAYQDGALNEAGAAAYRQHLASCPQCREAVNDHSAIAQQLRNESSPPSFLSPAAAARIRQNMSSRMRRAMIMNNMKAYVAGTAVIAVLALIVGLFAWQMRGPETDDTAEPAILDVTPEATEPVVTPEATVAPEALNEQLVAAVEAADAAEVERLLQAGADANLPDSEGNALLPQAAQAGDLAMVEALVSAGAELDGLFRSSVDGTELRLPALAWAAPDNHIEIAEFLIEHGADVDQAAPVSGYRPVHIAAWLNHPEMVKLLLDHGSDPDETNVAWGDDGTPLHVAMMYGSVEAMRALLDGGAAVNLQFGPGTTLLMLVQYQTLEAQPERRDELTSLLLEYGADPNLLDDSGNTALHHAARWDRVTTIPLLVEHGASLNVQNVAGKTPLDLATDPAVIELLQDLGAEPAAASGSVSE
ncbi:MAG: ankyrin repeat domain-containing protein [Chloroflexota bacterium]